MRLSYLLPASGVPVQGPSGASAHVRGLVRALRTRHEVELVAALRGDHRDLHGEELECRVSGLTPWPRMLQGRRELREILTARRLGVEVLQRAWADGPPDLIIERHSLFSDAGWRVHRRLGVPWVLEVNAPLCAERERFEELRHPRLGRRWEREVLQAAPAIVAVSRWLVDWLVEEMGCRNVTQVPNGTSSLRGDRSNGRALLGLEPDDFAVGFVGSMKPWHGVERLPHIASAAGGRLVLIGPGEVPGVADDTVRVGFLEGQDLADAVAALDVGLAPYHADSPPWWCPLKIFDYRAQGTPVVASDVGELRELVGSGGTVVDAADDDAHIEAIRAWRGRPVRPFLRSWEAVGGEVLAAAGVDLAGLPRRGLG